MAKKRQGGDECFSSFNGTATVMVANPVQKHTINL